MALSRSGNGKQARPAKGKVRFVKSVSSDGAKPARKARTVVKAVRTSPERKTIRASRTAEASGAAKESTRAPKVRAPKSARSRKVKSAAGSGRARTPKIAQKRTRTRTRRPSDVDATLPTWKDLLDGNDREMTAEVESHSFLAAIPTVRFVLGVLAVACLFTLYVGHVYSTQDLVADVQSLRKENLNLHLDLNRVGGEMSGKTSPETIYERAAQLGLTERIPEGEPVIVPD